MFLLYGAAGHTQAVAAGLRREGMAVDIALGGQQALDRAPVMR